MIYFKNISSIIPNRRKIIIYTIRFSLLWLTFEYMVYIIEYKKLKKAIINLKKELIGKYSQKPKYTSSIAKEFSNYNHNCEKHILFTMNNSFNLSSQNLKSVINNIERYNDKFIDNNYSLLDNDKQLLCFPILFRIMFSISNNYQIIKWKMRYKIQKNIINNDSIYEIVDNSEKFKYTIIIFTGLGGSLYPFNNIINKLIKLKYRILIPIYLPAQASLNYNFNCFEDNFYENLLNYLMEKNINYFDVLGWSLGGMLYRGFDTFLHKKNKKMIKLAYLIEPLLGIRGTLDVYFCKKRTYNDTIKIIDSVTDKKYSLHNRIFAYMCHSPVGYGTGNSFYKFYNMGSHEIKFDYPRYLFISSDDIIINNKLDTGLIEKNFDTNKIFYRLGYHGGWINSSKIIPIFENIVKFEK